MKYWIIGVTLLFLAGVTALGAEETRIVEFETNQTTSSDVTLSPDGKTLIFTMVGHLFRVSVDGGEAEQLTFGACYDSDPSFSPDGKNAVFVSDRDGTEGNVFVLDMTTLDTKQITSEEWAGRPVFSPDGGDIAYLSKNKKGARFIWTTWDKIPATVRRISLNKDKEPVTLSGKPALLRSVFFLPDGRVGWTAIERGEVDATSRIRIMNNDGAVTTMRTIPGVVDVIVPDSEGKGFYIRRFRPLPETVLSPEELMYISFEEEEARFIGALSASSLSYISPEFDVSEDNASVFLAETGKLWKVNSSSGSREYIPFHAKVKLEVLKRADVPKMTLPDRSKPVAPRNLHAPKLSPDKRRLVATFGRGECKTTE